MDKNISPLKRNSFKYDSIELFSLISKEQDYIIDSDEDIDRFITDISLSFKKNNTKNMQYGKRVEKMFPYVASALGMCKIIKQEDSGEIFTNDSILVPDYRFVLTDKNQFLVEVKNYNQKQPYDDFLITIKNYNKYLNYAKAMNIPLFFAIYWRKWGTWTLIDSSAFSKKNNNMCISITDAIMNNNMNVLGDYMIATTFPLKIRMYADKNKERKTIGSNINFTIKSVEFYSASSIIENKEEQSIIWNLVMFGRWKESNEVIFEKDSNLVDYIEFVYTPEEKDDSKTYAHIADASEIISNQYINATSKSDGSLKNIVPFGFDNKFGIGISNPYIKKDLPLWIFYVSKQDN